MEETYETTNLGSAQHKNQPKLQGLQTKKLYLLLLTLWAFTQNRIGSNIKYGVFVNL